MNLSRLSVAALTPAAPGTTVTVHWEDGPETCPVIGWAVMELADPVLLADVAQQHVQDARAVLVGGAA